MKTALAMALLAVVSLVVSIPMRAAADPAAISLYPPGTVKPLPVPERIEDFQHNGLRIIRNVSEPALTAFLPAPGKANGAAVIIAPGGGFMMLSWDSEGVLVAQRLAQEGVTAFVLKYRLPQTPEGKDAFVAALTRQVTHADELVTPTPDHPNGRPFPGEAMAAEDAAQAMRLVRERAGQWSIDPNRVGFIGFSAGAITTVNVAVGDESTRPAFVGIIYGALRGSVPADAPPAFIAASADDPLLGSSQIPLFEAWRRAARPAELHIFERGGHGYGAVPQGASSDRWIDEFVWWMQARGLLKSGS